MFRSYDRNIHTDELHGLFIDRQHNTARPAKDTVARPRRIDNQIASFDYSRVVFLRTREHQNMFVARVLMQWDASARLKAEKRGAWANLFSIQPVNLDFRSKGFPRKALVPLGNAKESPSLRISPPPPGGKTVSGKGTLALSVSLCRFQFRYRLVGSSSKFGTTEKENGDQQVAHRDNRRLADSNSLSVHEAKEC